jgi:hypothetical protein
MMTGERPIDSGPTDAARLLVVLATVVTNVVAVALFTRAYAITGGGRR